MDQNGGGMEGRSFWEDCREKWEVLGRGMHYKLDVKHIVRQEFHYGEVKIVGDCLEGHRGCGSLRNWKEGE